MIYPPDEISLPPSNPIWSYKIHDAPNEGMKMEWISIEDKLPPNQSECINSKPVLAIDVKNQIYIATYINDMESWFDYHNMSTKSIDITHWMPLPEPPTSF